MAGRYVVQRADGRRISRIRHSKRRRVRTIWVATERSKIFQLRRGDTVPETNRGTRRAGREATSSRAFRLSKCDFKSAKRYLALPALEEQCAAGRHDKLLGGAGGIRARDPQWGKSSACA